MRLPASLPCCVRGLFMVLLAAGVLLWSAGPAASQKPEAKPEKPKPPPDKKDFFATTPDGVKLVGDYYPPGDIVPARPKRESPCVILLHSLRQGASRKDFGTLPVELQRKGFAVLAFDFRGFGQSTAIDDQDYFKYHPAKAPPGNRKVLRLSRTDFRTHSDWLQMCTDIEEAKLFLNKKSDAGVADCNSNNVCFIGAEHGGLLAMLWTVHGLRAQQQRQFDGRSQNGTLVAGPRFRVDGKREGEDVNCIITLSTNQFLGTQNVEKSIPTVGELLRDRKVGVLALLGEKDGPSSAFWGRNFKWFKPEKDKDQLDRVALKRLEKTDLVGAKLLGNNEALKTEDYINAYLEKPSVLKERDRPWQRKSEEELQPTVFAIDQIEQLLK